jgi:hypothetical protein
MRGTMGNPCFNKTLKAAAATLQSKPPTRFDGVTARVFPLRANMHRLAVFCDAYLNVAPEVTRFNPVLPFVYLMALDYGKMSVQAGNLGWVSQHEVAFAVPLEWHRPGPDGRMVLDWAMVCPFIFVDDDMSLSTGREVYGWPKVRAWLSGQVNPWISDPLAVPPLMALSTMVYPELFAGRRQEPRVLLEIRGERLASMSQVPPDPRGPASLLSILPEAASGYASLLAALTEMVARSPLWGFPGARPPGRAVDPRETTGWLLAALSRGPSVNNITLKQFRDAEHPGRLCYQGVLCSEMRIERFNGGGMLGDARLLVGDPTGGHRIVVRRYAAQPIVESLGLEVAAETVVDDVPLATLKPLFPFWVGVDLSYGVGNAVCWRTLGSPWHVPPADSSRPPEVGAPAQRPAAERHRFNTTLGAALQDVTGPFVFPNVTLRVLPLMADPKQLQSFCATYLENTHYAFEPWGSYVYLVLASYEEMASGTDNIGWWADREVTFFVPVKRRSNEDTLLSVGMIPAFTYVNTTTAAITGSEVNGKPTFEATLESPPSTWMSTAGPAAEAAQPLLVMRTMVLPVLGLGQKAEQRILLEVRRDDALPQADTDRWEPVADHWGRMLLHDHERKLQQAKTADFAETELFADAKALALEVLTLGQPLNTFTLKQFRDAGDPDRACYQGIVQGRRVIDEIYDLREIDELLHVRLHRYPNQPVQEVLGLRRKCTEVRGTVAVDVLQPIRPFWMRVALREELGRNLCWRAGDETWQAGRPLDDGCFSTDRPENRWKPAVGRSLARDLDEDGEKARHLRATAREWADPDDAGPRVSPEAAAAAVEAIEPQVVLEHILSAAWGDRGPLTRSRERRQADFWIRCDSVGPRDGPGSHAWEVFPLSQRSTDARWFSKEVAPPEDRNESKPR